MLKGNINKWNMAPELPTPKSSAAVATRWIEQKLDHFDEKETRTWQMRYMANDEFWQEGGPIVIFVGGLWNIYEGYLLGGHMYDMAKDNKAHMFYVEHRYYGRSWPTSDMSIENLKYLNVHQVLADLAHFIRTIKSETPGMNNSKVALVGVSYSATLVTWFKKLYPDLAVGVWASSAPLVAKTNLAIYNEYAGDVIRNLGGDACYDRIQNAYTQMEELFATKRGAELKAMWQLCDNFDENNLLDQWSFFSEITEVITGIVVFHRGTSVQVMCNSFLKGDDAIAAVAVFVMFVMRPAECYDLSYNGVMKEIRNTTFSDMTTMRQWYYQTCNELGWYHTSDSVNQPFGTQFPVELYTKMCADAFGPQYNTDYIDQKVAKTNDFFGGLKPEVTNVYMSHGALDPWLSVAIQSKEQATIVPRYSHGKDFSSISERDSPEMLANKQKIAQLMREWLS